MIFTAPYGTGSAIATAVGATASTVLVTLTNTFRNGLVVFNDRKIEVGL